MLDAGGSSSYTVTEVSINTRSVQCCMDTLLYSLNADLAFAKGMEFEGDTYSVACE